MNQSEALNLAVQMLESVAPGINCDPREFHYKLREIKAAISPTGSGPEPIGLNPAATKTPLQPSSAIWPKTAIVGGEEFCEIDRRIIGGRDLILMESCRDGNEAPAIIVDADTNETLVYEACNGFRDFPARA